MRVPVVQGIIRRRLLVNFRVDPEIMQRQLPGRFKPKTHAGNAIAGVCLIRLEQIRPKLMPSIFGVSSENAAHRIAVQWEESPEEWKEGVFIPRRDTSSMINRLAGGTLFPGEHHPATFDVKASSDQIDLQMHSLDGQINVRVVGRTTTTLPKTSCFGSVSAASQFFESGSLGYSVTKDPNRLDGLTLKTKNWKIEPLEITDVYSSYFADPSRFPTGSVQFDCALIMRDMEHEWHSASDLYL